MKIKHIVRMMIQPRCLHISQVWSDQRYWSASVRNYHDFVHDMNKILIISHLSNISQFMILFHMTWRDYDLVHLMIPPRCLSINQMWNDQRYWSASVLNYHMHLVHSQFHQLNSVQKSDGHTNWLLSRKSMLISPKSISQTDTEDSRPRRLWSRKRIPQVHCINTSKYGRSFVSDWTTIDMKVDRFL